MHADLYDLIEATAAGRALLATAAQPVAAVAGQFARMCIDRHIADGGYVEIPSLDAVIAVPHWTRGPWSAWWVGPIWWEAE